MKAVTLFSTRMLHRMVRIYKVNKSVSPKRVNGHLYMGLGGRLQVNHNKTKSLDLILSMCTSDPKFRMSTFGARQHVVTHGTSSSY